MKGIELTRGMVAIVDDADYELMNSFLWRAIRNSKGMPRFYAMRDIYNSDLKTKSHELMHKVILGAKEEEQVDHINGDSLDNRRCNLRIATHAQNTANTRHRQVKGKGSVFRGVRKLVTWQARLGGRRNSVGSFPDEETAARAYDEAARKEYGVFAVLNFPEPHEMPPPRVTCVASGPRGQGLVLYEHQQERMMK